MIPPLSPPPRLGLDRSGPHYVPSPRFGRRLDFQRPHDVDIRPRYGCCRRVSSSVSICGVRFSVELGNDSSLYLRTPAPPVLPLLPGERIGRSNLFSIALLFAVSPIVLLDGRRDCLSFVSASITLAVQITSLPAAGSGHRILPSVGFMTAAMVAQFSSCDLSQPPAGLEAAGCRVSALDGQICHSTVNSIVADRTVLTDGALVLDGRDGRRSHSRSPLQRW